ncbi:MAG: hypothetical protein ACE5II_07250, partial [Anaerolineae bacterium]
TSFDQVEAEIQHPFQVTFDSLELLGYNREEKPVQAGDTIGFTLFWRALSDGIMNYTLVLQLIDAQSQLIESGLRYRLGTEAYPTSRWQPGEVIRGQYDYTIPAWPSQPSPGKAEMRVTLLDPRGVIRGTTPLFSLEVQETERLFEPPSPQYTIPEGSLGGLVGLVGYDLTADSVQPGDSFVLVLYWQALAPMDNSYTVFAHLLDGENQVRAQKDGLPAGGVRPTTGWVPGEFIIDEYELVVEADAPAGEEYLLEVGMYDASTGERLPSLDTEGRVLDNRMVLPTVIQVVAP